LGPNKIIEKMISVILPEMLFKRVLEHNHCLVNDLVNDFMQQRKSIFFSSKWAIKFAHFTTEKMGNFS